MNKNDLSFFLLVVAVLISCKQNKQQIHQESKTETINFGKTFEAKASDFISKYQFIKLETTDQSLLATISQLEIFDNKIYILDYNANSIFEFSIDGQFVKKLNHIGDGPGEFSSIQSFQIDKKGGILIYDMQLNRLLKYRLNDFSFIEAIEMPTPRPKFFKYSNAEELFYYYADKGQTENKSDKIIISSDKNGLVNNQMINGEVSEWLFHVSPTSLYEMSEKLFFHPSFTNKIFELSKDTFLCKYKLVFGENIEIDNEIFEKRLGTMETFDQIMASSNNWIRLMYVFENTNAMLVKYYVRKELFLALWDKKNSIYKNCKLLNITDDLGFGGKMPTPIGKYENKFVAQLTIPDIDTKKVTDSDLNTILSDTKSDDNPILMLFTAN
jgi:hypothetical protein